MKCINCVNFDLERYPKHAKAGFGRCKLVTEIGKFMSTTFEHDCKDYKEASPEAIAANRELERGKS